MFCCSFLCIKTLNLCSDEQVYFLISFSEYSNSFCTHVGTCMYHFSECPENNIFNKTSVRQVIDSAWFYIKCLMFLACGGTNFCNVGADHET